MSTIADNLEVSAKTGKGRFGVQISLLAIVAFLGGYVVLYSDRHNDTRYVSQSSYAADQAQQAKEAARDSETASKIHTLEQQAINTRLDDLSKKTDEISSDVKTLINSRYSQRPQDQ